MRVLIFGGTGAMGTPLVELLASEGNDVFVTSRKFRNSSDEKIHYIKGDAHEKTFVEGTLREHYDALVDFMVYEPDELSERLSLLLDSVGQYVFLSSCRVYAESKTLITEETPRLLDVCDDEAFLASNNYSLAKAREENILLASGRKNWTIVRPSVTYNSRRLQLGCYELEHWLYRALNGRPIVFFEDLMDKITPMTYGGDVAKGIAGLIGNNTALGEIFNIVTPETMTWEDIMNLYFDTLKNRGVQTQVLILPQARKMEEALGRVWRLKYNKGIDRAFDSSKLDAACGGMEYTPMREGLVRCLIEFLDSDRRFGSLNIKSEAYMDKITHVHTPFSEFSSAKEKAKYAVARYTPYFALANLKRHWLDKKF